MELRGSALMADIVARARSRIELMTLNHGIFDEGAVSVISLATIAGIGREAGLDLDRRRFRANIVLETVRDEPFAEDAWIGGTLIFGQEATRPALSVTERDERCMMVNLDPDTAAQDPRVMKAIVRLNDNHAGIYTTVLRRGTIRVGDRVGFVPASPALG
jgi:uncharacterized protein YcbX